MITPMQIRLGRAALEISQQELADRVGMQKTKIFRLEKSITDGKSSDLEMLRIYFENMGLEFTEGDGIRKKLKFLQLQGFDGFKVFMDDVYETMKRFGGEACVFNVNEKNWIKWMGKSSYNAHSHRMKEINKPISFRIIVEEGDNFYIASKFAAYRHISKEYFNEQSFYSYGEKLALIRFSDSNVFITIINDAELTSGYRSLFDIAWNTSTIEAR